MSIGSFIFGLVMMVVGFNIVWKTQWFLNNFGDLGDMLGLYGKPWLSWKTFGIFFMLLGFLIAFGLLQLFLTEVLGRLFFLG